MNIIPKYMSKRFMKMVDELVVFADKDPELAEGIKWIDMQSREKGFSFYEMTYLVLSRHDIDKKAKDWLSSKK